MIGPNKKYEIEVEESDGGLIVDVEGRRAHVEIQQVEGENSYDVRVDRKSFSTHVEEETESLITLTLDGETVTYKRPGVVGQDPRSPEPQAMQVEAKALHSPMAGKVISVQAKPGMLVKDGATIVVIESMKMESVIRSDRNGRIKVVSVKQGDAVSRGQVLVHFN